ncbi:class A beta-lactamase-related serine hydrolase [Luteipulveratus sp. YIM 133132]|uniref:serine hydrolase n=1 Tax=Luteipulveratus flavus TaxID=3031728 RepID=UPI0023B0E9FD|nr:serine hydrolase [Luteipulveratus sp. YIM 133132]MDE9365146.1 class A beta-lactamase-related serine hydrolase [Luteipulveratus sp. YIM 133132]
MSGSVSWSIHVEPLDDPGGEPWWSETPDEVLRTASVGKLILLAVVAERIASGEQDPTERLRWESDEFVRDSGLWQALDQRDLSVVDACRLVGAVSDNLATNVLLRHVGLDAVAGFASEHDLAPMALLDRVRDARDPSQPGVAPTLSRASARSVVRYLRLLHDGTVQPMVRDWLALGSDLSMVAAAFGLDPLAHAVPDRDVLLLNKTGTDTSVRADVGLVTFGGRTVAYAVLASWEGDADHRDEVLARMRLIGQEIRRAGLETGPDHRGTSG